MLAQLNNISLKGEKQLSITIDNFKGGTNTLVSAPRLKPNEAVESLNLILVQDGLYTKRYGTKKYGGVLAGSKIDGFGEYRKTDGVRELIVFSGGLAQRKASNSWITISGYTPTAGLPVYTTQINDRLYACNGTDELAYYNGTEFLSYTSITTPTGVSGTRNTLTTGDYNYYIQVTATNEVGETIGSSEVTLAINKSRDTWINNDTTQETLTWTWDKVTDASKYKVYISDTSGREGYVTQLGQSDNPTWTDTGKLLINDFIYPPNLDTSSGPKFKYMCISGGRIWGCGDPNNPWRIYWSGEQAYLGNFSYGGGWVDLEKGGKAITKGIIDYQGKPAVFCPTPDGRGAIYQISVAVDATWGTTIPTVSKITNQISGIAPRGLVQAENDVFFVTKRGVYLLGNEPGVMSTVLRTNELSARIRDYLEGMSEEEVTSICSYYRDGKLFFSTPTRMFIYDRERLCWIKDWNIGFTQMADYTDDDGVTHFLGAGSTTPYLYEISPNYEGDDGVAFNTSYLSPQIPVSSGWTDFAKITKAYINVGNVKGTLNFEVTGVGKKGSFKALATKTISPGVSSSGLGWDLLGSVLMGDSTGFPKTFTDSSLIKYMKINKILRQIQFHLTTTTLDSSYVLLGLKCDGFAIQTNLPSSYKL
jgi:hypothetical protein